MVPDWDRGMRAGAAVARLSHIQDTTRTRHTGQPDNILKFRHNLSKSDPIGKPYKGAAPAITDLIGGQIQVMFTTVASAASLIEGGQLRALAVTSAERSPAFPQLPTVAEAGVPGYAAESWYGLFAPAGTPADIIGRLNKSAATAVQSEAFKRLSVNEGLVMIARPPEELDRYFRGEEERWRKVIQDAGIKVE
jgi:tripartite-type tricarboxylate transporter receptor subunit TctC